MTIGSKNYYDVTPGTGYACLYDEELGFYVPHANDANKGLRIDGRSTAPYYCLSNGAKYRYVNGNAYLGSRNDNYNQLFLFVDDLTNEEGQETYRNQTQIYHIKGDLIIDTNLIVGRNYNPGSGNILADIFDDIQQIPQVIIMADRIYVSSRVTRIDAWLIADGAHGTINTCAYDGYSGFTGGQYIKDPGSHSILNAKICDRSILFNGPVFAKNMILNRTAGAGTQTLGANQYWGYGMPNLYIDGSSYSQRGEIFNLRSDAYLWGYYQAQRSGILTTVFTHELPTRY
jgi:hypothetical protein